MNLLYNLILAYNCGNAAQRGPKAEEKAMPAKVPTATKYQVFA
jgi:hypothetical protein